MEAVSSPLMLYEPIVVAGAGDHGLIFSACQRMKTITLEEHFATPSYLDGPGIETRALASNPAFPIAKLPAQLMELGEQRIAEMDAGGVDMQVLSLNAPGVEQLHADAAISFAKETNDYLAKAIDAYPMRFAGFAAVPTADPGAAVTELERAINQLHFVGAAVNGHVNGRYLDDPFFYPLLEAAEAMNIPVYLHPTQPPQPVVDIYYRGFSPQVDAQFARSGWGWHIETAIHLIRMILGGVFDRFPKLQIIVGHMGESLPSMLQRMDRSMPVPLTGLKHSVSTYLRRNVHYTFSGFNFTPVFLNLLLEVGVDRIMFSADYPYSSMRQARDFLDKLPVSPDDRDRIAFRNAQNLLRLKE